MNPTIFIKDSIYAVQYISDTRKDKSLLLVLDPQQPICCDGDSAQFVLPCGFRQPLFDIDKHAIKVIELLQGLLKDVAYNSPQYWIIHDMLVHLNAQQNRNYACFKAFGHEAPYIADRLVDYYTAERHSGDTRNQFYCGVTYDVDIRMSEHEEKDQKTYHKCLGILCRTETIAETVEGIMRDKGFCIGKSDKQGNGAKNFSRYVYLYRR